MKYIKKLDTPQFFTDDTKGLGCWDDYHNLDQGESKRKLRTYLIDNEQFGICIYCECKIEIRSSHLEHIKPKSKYGKDTFNYDNISVSCEGTTHNPAHINTAYNCGHEKDDQYDDTLFLNPTIDKNIREYLDYDLRSYEIAGSNKDTDKSNYMIETLKLNSEYLTHGRKIRLRSFKKTLKKIKNIDDRKNTARTFIAKDTGPFISFLIFYCNSVFT